MNCELSQKNDYSINATLIFRENIDSALVVSFVHPIAPSGAENRGDPEKKRACNCALTSHALLT